MNDAHLAAHHVGLEQEPALGAHLASLRRGYQHQGVYVGRGRVVHYSGLSGFWQWSDYRLLTNNCEHFCNWCLSGVSRSAQVEGRLQLPLRIIGALFHA